jgi:RHS repeat-associated protein
MLYLYDGEGRRVAKVSNPTFSCTPATGSTLLETYLLGPSGEHITELGQAGAFVRSNVYANGQLLATYTNNQSYFALNDWLGSKRVVTKYDGTVAQMCMNLPFGDELMCSTTDLSEQHFTGQIHDQESGNDYFNARSYSNSTGRFLSPDYSESGPEPVPYADTANPQSLNLYAYVLNNPLRLTDPDGHGCLDSQATVTSDVSTSTGGGDVSESVFVNGGCNPAPISLTQVQSTTQIDPQRTTSSAPNNAPTVAAPSPGVCTAAGAVAGASAGALVGEGLGALAGGGVGTLVAPGVGTVGGGALGATGGATAGAAIGSVLGGIVGNVLCAKGGGSSFGGNQRENRQASDAKNQAERITGKQFTPALERMFHDEVTGMNYSYQQLVQTATEILEMHG